jgi:hypothetical protein
MSAGGEVPVRGEETLEELHRQINESKRKLKEREKSIREEATAVGGNPQSFSQAPVGFSDGGEVPSVSLEPESLGVDEGGLWDAYGAGALSLEQLRKAVDALKKNRPGGGPGIIRRDYLPASAGSIETPRGPVRYINVAGDYTKRMKPSGIPQNWRWASRKEMRKGAGLPPESREAYNRSVFLHEGEEIRAGAGTPRRGSSLQRFSSHRSTRPPLIDLNIAATLEDKLSPAADVIRAGRAKEIQDLKRLMPGIDRLDLGNKRLSRHAIKNLQEAYTDKREAAHAKMQERLRLMELDYQESLRHAESLDQKMLKLEKSIDDPRELASRKWLEWSKMDRIRNKIRDERAKEIQDLNRKPSAYGGEDSSIPPSKDPSAPPAYEKLDRHGEIVRESDMPSYHSDEWVAKEITPEMAKAKKVTPLLDDLHNVPLNLRDFGPNLAEGFHDPSQLSASYPPGAGAERLMPDTPLPIPEPATITLGDPLAAGGQEPWRDALMGKAGTPYVPEDIDPNSPWGRYIKADADRIQGRVDRTERPLIEGMDSQKIKNVVEAGPGPTRFRADWMQDSPEFARSIAKEADKFLPMQSKIARAAAPYARGLAKGIGAAGAVIGPSIPAYELGRQWESSVMDDGVMDRFGSANKRAGLANAMQRKPEMFAPGAFEAYSSMTDADWDKMSGFGQGYIERGKAYSPGPLEFWNSPLYFPKNKRDLAAAWPKHAGPIPEHLMPESYANPPPLFNRPLPANPPTLPQWMQERGSYMPMPEPPAAMPRWLPRPLPANPLPMR